MSFYSIVTINYNQAEDLEKTLRSIEFQSFRDYESIVVDGGSSDSSLAVMKQFSHIISQSVSEKDKGIYDAMNKGLMFSKGKWLIFMNAGDIFSGSDTLEKCRAMLDETHADGAYGNSVISYPGMIRVQKALPVKEWKRMPYIHQSAFFLTEVCRQFPFDLSWSICADYDQFLRMKRSGIKFSILPFTISEVSSGGKSDVKRSLASREKKEIYKKHYPENKFNSIYFWAESIKGKTVQFFKKLLPLSVINTIREIKYKVL